METMKSNIHFTGRLLVTIVLAALCPGPVGAVSLGPDCEPSGFIAKRKEAWDPKSFWTTQIKEIKEYVEGQQTAYRLYMIERGKMNELNEFLFDAAGALKYTLDRFERFFS